MFLGIPELYEGMQNYDAVPIFEGYLEDRYGDVEKEYRRSDENERIYRCFFYPVSSDITYVLEFFVVNSMDWRLVGGYSF